MSLKKLESLLAFDQNQRSASSNLIAGVDEVGRGPLAGPVVAAAVILKSNHSLHSLNDSKQVSALRRQDLFWQILKSGLVGIGVVFESEIDSINIYQATRVAMKKAVLSLTRTPDQLLIDGNMKLDLPIAQKSIIKGDAKSASIAAASIIAKVYRDAWMEKMDDQYPDYGFKSHKGYPTPVHLQRLKEKGPVTIHRKSFAPVRELILPALL